MSLVNPCRLPEMAWRVIDGEAVVVDTRNGLIYPLNEVATVCWEMMDGTHSIQDLVASVVDSFDVEIADAQVDVEAFLEECRAKGLMDK